jgi:hypothetical protein
MYKYYPTFKIHGKERKKIKKDLNSLKSFAKHFWHYHQLEKDLGSTYIMSDVDANKKYRETLNEINKIESELSITTAQIIRDEKLNQIL